MSTGGKSILFSTDSHHHKKWKTLSNSSSGRAGTFGKLSEGSAPFMKLEDVAAPIGKGNFTQTINDEEE